MDKMVSIDSFYKGKRVFITGHNGFKGSWMCQILVSIGADVVGFSLVDSSTPSFFNLCGLGKSVKSVYGDIRELDAIKNAISQFRPEIVFHLAAQPIVRESYLNPVYTFETNIMGSINVLESIRNCDSVSSFVNVTTDKVYENHEWPWGYRESDSLNGFDPYSNSKSCSELVTSSYRKSFFSDHRVAISTARAGNVIGGGDFSIDRIIPDCVRAIEKGLSIGIRNPNSTRPYQHVLEPVFAYLLIAQRQFENAKCADNYNVGPNDASCISTSVLVDYFCDKWGNNATWTNISNAGVHEANFLKLDCSKIKRDLGWEPRWDIETAVEKTVQWYKAYLERHDQTELAAIMHSQIDEYINIVI